MLIRCLAVGPLETNCYLVYRKGCGDAMVIDPGGDADAVLEKLRAAKLTVRFIVNTHGHADHIGANAEVKREFTKARIAVHADDAPMLPSPAKNLSFLADTRARSPAADLLLRDGDIIEVCGMKFRIIHAPGHTPGGICLYHPADKPHAHAVLFCGDTLFAGSVGRSDFPGGDADALLKSIRERLLALPDDTRVYPGHGPATTIGRERASNPFLEPEKH